MCPARVQAGERYSVEQRADEPLENLHLKIFDLPETFGIYTI